MRRLKASWIGTLAVVGLLAACAAATGCGSSPVTPSPVAVPAPASPAVTPVAPPRTIHGTVEEIDGGPLAGVLIASPYKTTTFTDGSGAFTLEYPGISSMSLVTAALEGFETADQGFGPGSGDVQLPRIRLQRIIQLSPSAPVAAHLSPNDHGLYTGEAYDSDYCQPCKVVRLRTDVPQNIRLDLTWTGDDPLQLWAHVSDTGLPTDVVKGAIADTGASASLAVSVRAGETLVYVGLPYQGSLRTIGNPIAFRLTDSTP